MFTVRFLISNIIISAVFIIFITVEKLFENKLSPKTGYMLWFPFIMLTICAFMPSFNLPVSLNNGISTTITEITSKSDLNYSSDIKDLYVSVSNYSIIPIIWITGICVHMVTIITGIIKLKKLTHYKINSPLFVNCCKRLNVKADFYVSPHVNSPLSYGIIRPKVILPDIKLKDKELEHIVIHELVHHKHKDILINFILCILNALYWFNPFIYIAFNRIRLDMEIYCDYTAIKYTGSNIDYGNTVINLTEQNIKFKAASYMSGRKGELKSRITRIADFNKKYSSLCRRAVVSLLIIISLTASLIINCFGYTINDNYNENINIDQIDLSSYFKDYEGCFVLYDTSDKSYKVWNENMARERVSPYSTYKIAIALNGLEKGVITTDNSYMSWNGTSYPFEEWEMDHDLDSAMKNSVNWYFQNIDKNLTMGEISDFLKRVDYGNMSAGYDKENYWLENSLKISPLEQVQFLKRIYNNEFDFDEKNINAVLNSIKLSDDLYGKTGTGMVNNKTTSGWFIGMDDKYIFALRIAGDDNATGTVAYEIAEDILSDLQK